MTILRARQLTWFLSHCSLTKLGVRVQIPKLFEIEHTSRDKHTWSQRLEFKTCQTHATSPLQLHTRRGLINMETRKFGTVAGGHGVQVQAALQPLCMRTEGNKKSQGFAPWLAATASRSRPAPSRSCSITASSSRSAAPPASAAEQPLSGQPRCTHSLRGSAQVTHSRVTRRVDARCRCILAARYLQAPRCGISVNGCPCNITCIFDCQTWR